MKKAVKLTGIFIVLAFLLSAIPFAVFSQTTASGQKTVSGQTAAESSINVKIKQSIILYAGSPVAYVNGAEKRIDPDNLAVTPVIIQNAEMVPVRFIAESLGGSAKWDGASKTATIVLDGRSYMFTQGSSVMTSGSKGYSLGVPVQSYQGRTFVPLDKFTEIVGKKAIYERGLIIISNTQIPFDKVKDKALISEWISKLSYLPVVGSKEKLMSLLQEQLNNAPMRYGGIMLKSMNGMATSTVQNAASAEAAAAAPAGAAMDAGAMPQAGTVTEAGKLDSAAGDYSATNVQVQGVDEGDIVKTDGNYIYQVNKQRVVIVKANPSESMKVMGIINYADKNLDPQEIYLQGQKLVVIGMSQANFPIYKEGNGIKTEIYPSRRYWQSSTKVLIYDISDKGNAHLLREVELEGSYVSSRKIGSSLYLVANDYIDYYRIQNNEINSTPSYKDSISNAGYKNVGYNSICYFPGSVEPNYMMVAGIDIDGTQTANVTTYLGSGQNIYASAENLYVSVTGYTNVTMQNTNGAAPTTPAPTTPATTAPAPNTQPPAANTGSAANSGTATVKTGTAMPGIDVESKPGIVIPKPGIVVARPGTAPNTFEENTQIYKFAMKDAKLTYLCKGSVPGTILNQFSMDELGGTFRIATTRGNTWATDDSISKNALYVLDSMLTITGKVDDMAPGERIYSVRFMGDRAYVVTFKTVDPLFVVDLKDPTKPIVLGALKIPGYSDYLHPYDENHIIGFGKDTTEMKGQAYYQGMKIALFDVTDVSKPIQMFSEVIGDRGTDSELLRNHKALLFSKEKNLLAFPVTLMERKDSSGKVKSDSLEYGQFTFQGAYIFSVDLKNGFKLKGRITHLSNEDYLKAGNSWYESDKNVQRIIYIGDRLYTLSNSMIKANAMVDLKEKGSVLIP